MPPDHPSAEREALVTAVWARVAKAWPDLAVDQNRFFDHLRSLLPAGAHLAAASTLFIEDLGLAFACASGSRAAIEAFEREYGGELVLAAPRVRGGPTVDDARQLLHQKLFVASERARPKVLDYSGKAPLRQWYRVSVMRTLLDHVRSKSQNELPAAQHDLADLPSARADPEADYLKRVYGQEFRLAFEQAIQSLTAEDRNVLRSHYVGELSIDQIASVFGIHRATAARRLGRARETLLDETRRRLQEKLKMSQTELESIMRLIESQLHVSVQRLLT